MSWLERAAAEATRRYGELPAPPGFADSVQRVARQRLLRARIEPTARHIDKVARSLVLSDLYLALACDHGLPGAWDAFLRCFAPRLRELALRHGASATEAHELATELPGELCLPGPGGRTRTRLGAYEGTGSLEAWLAVVVARRVVDRIRGRARRAGLASEDALSAAADPPDLASAEDDRERFASLFRAAWQTLTPRETVAIRLCHLDGRDQTTVARLLGVTQPSVSRLLSSAIAKLRAYVAEAIRSSGPIDPKGAASVLGLVIARGSPPDSAHGARAHNDSLQPSEPESPRGT